MKKSVFSASKLANFAVVTKGTKTTNDARPEVITQRAINKFVLNGSASTLLNVQDGDSVVIITNPRAESMDEKFLIAKAAGGAKLATTGHKKGLGLPMTFSYSSVWSLIVQGKVDAKPLGEQALVEMGLMKEYPTQLGRKDANGNQEMCYANLTPYVVAYTLALVTDEDDQPLAFTDPNTGITYEEVFVLCEAITREKDDDNKVEGEEVVTEEGEVVYEADEEDDEESL